MSQPANAPGQDLPAEHSLFVPPLPIQRLRFTLRMAAPVRLPAWPGSALRGLLGHGLRRTVCVTGQRDCDACLLKTRCLYTRFFDVHVGLAEACCGRGAVPHPWVLDVASPSPRMLAAGDRLAFHLVLIGEEAAEQLPYLVHALERAGHRGLGPSNAPFTLAMVEQETVLGLGGWRTLYEAGSNGMRTLTPVDVTPLPAAGFWRLHLVSPLRFKRRGRLVGPREFEPVHVWQLLRDRWTGLVACFGASADGVPADLLSSLPAEALSVVSLQWRDWTRYSSRQRTRMQLGGLVGSLRVDSDVLDRAWPWLWLGQWLHLGKQTTMGLGQYRLLPEGAA